MKKGEEKLDRKNCIDDHAGLFINANGSITFNRNQRPELFVRQLGYSLGNIMDGLTFFARKRKNRVSAQFGKAATQFRLKNYNKSDGQKDGEAADDPANNNEVQEL